MPTHAIVAGQSNVTSQQKLMSNAIMTFNDTAFVKFSNVPGGVYVLVVYTANRHGNGSNGNAYGLLSGLWIDRAAGTGVAYFATGVANDSSGARSNFSAIEEQGASDW